MNEAIDGFRFGLGALIGCAAAYWAPNEVRSACHDVRKKWRGRFNGG